MSKREKVFEDMENDGPVFNTPPIYSLYRRPPKVKLDRGEGPGADQSFKDECDIRRIMDRARKTGVLVDPLALAKSLRLARYEDVSEIPADFFEANLFVMEATKAFGDLPAKVRKRFGNDVQALLEFVANPENKAEAISLGLVPAPDKAAQAAPPPTSSTGGDPA